MSHTPVVTLTADDLARSNFYARLVADNMGDDVAAITFRYTARDGEVSMREAKPVEIVGTPGMSTHGFKGETDKGPRTFNFHLMDGSIQV
jgi:hypothetical protein